MPKNKELQWREQEAQDVALKRSYQRISARSVLHETLETFNLNRGMLFTIRQLLLVPEKVIWGYLNAERYRYSNPVRFIVLLTSIFIFLLFQIQSPDLLMDVDQASTKAEREVVNIYQSYFVPYMQVWTLLSLFFYAKFSKTFFKKLEFNYMEHLTLTAYLQGLITFLQFLSLPCYFFYQSAQMEWFNIILMLAVYLRAYHRCFSDYYKNAGWRSIAVVALGYLSYMFLILIIFSMAGVVYGYMAAQNASGT